MKIRVEDIDPFLGKLLFETLKFYSDEGINFAASLSRKSWKDFFLQWVQDQDHEFFQFRVRDEAINEVVGFFNIDYQLRDKMAEIEFFLLPQYRYLGLGVECLLAIEKFLKRDFRYQHLETIYANAVSKESISVLKKAGYFRDIDGDWYRYLKNPFKKQRVKK